MSKATIGIIIVVAILILGGGLYWYSTQEQASLSGEVSGQKPSDVATPPGAVAPAPTGSTQMTGNDSLPMAATVTYTNSGFSPASVTIAKGGTVTFNNSASGDVWVGADPHPIHTDYPTTGGCLGSTFDSCKRLHPGESWSFTFDIVGSWKYHNHVSPRNGGVVVVE